MHHGAYSVIIILYEVVFAESGVTLNCRDGSDRTLPDTYDTSKLPTPPLIIKLPYSFQDTTLPKIIEEILETCLLLPEVSVAII